jgi:HTH-type transcriptional regulator/antitoxin HigA
VKAKLIKNETEYAAALARVDKLMDAKAGASHGDKLKALSLLIHEYEERTFPIAKPDLTQGAKGKDAKKDEAQSPADLNV